MKNITGKTLICPLNWGLGHATRCIPIIRQLLNDGVEVLIAAEGYPLQLLHQEFPKLPTIEFSSYRIFYDTNNSLVKTMFRQLPIILSGIVREHKMLKKIVREQGITQVISDNRFGLWNKHVHTVYITHQLMIKMPKKHKWLEPIVWLLHRFIINRYNECWIPDFPEDGGLSGDLAHKYRLPRNAKFIGPLSRFTASVPEENTAFETVAVISGPEPQRSLFENILMKQLQKQLFPSLIVRGTPSDNKTFTRVGNVTLVSHLSAKDLLPYLLGASIIICRSGYSSVMDLYAIGRTALLEPTPGQTEQEYLAEYLQGKGFQYKKQEELGF